MDTANIIGGLKWLLFQVLMQEIFNVYRADTETVNCFSELSETKSALHKLETGGWRYGSKLE